MVNSGNSYCFPLLLLLVQYLSSLLRNVIRRLQVTGKSQSQSLYSLS